MASELPLDPVMASTRTSVAVSLLFTLFGGPALVLVLLPWYITHFRMPAGEAVAQIVTAGVMIALGLAPLLESIVRFVLVGRGTLMPAMPTEHLVVSGLYRYVRNPMYIGVLTVIAGEALLLESRQMVVYGACACLAMHLFVCLYEERKLARKYGEEYARFRRNVPRWIPRVTPWTGR